PRPISRRWAIRRRPGIFSSSSSRRFRACRPQRRSSRRSHTRTSYGTLGGRTVSASHTDQTTNDQLAAHLSRQDTRLDELFTMFEVSIADRADLHAQLDGHGQRIAGLEARMTVQEQQTARVERAIGVQLRISDWWEAHKVRANIVA